MKTGFKFKKIVYWCGNLRGRQILCNVTNRIISRLAAVTRLKTKKFFTNSNFLSNSLSSTNLSSIDAYRFHQLIGYYVIWPHKRNSNQFQAIPSTTNFECSMANQADGLGIPPAIQHQHTFRYLQRQRQHN